MKDRKESLSVVMPVYNEQDIIEVVVRDWYDTLDSMDIDFVIRCYNDGSKDETGKILDRLGATLPRLVVNNQKNSGHGPTIIKGYLDAAESDWIFQVDSDNEIAADQFARLWQVREGFDFILGRRSHAGFPASRQVISFFARQLIKFGFGASMEDVNSPFRLFRSAVVVPLIRSIPLATFAPNILITGLVEAKKLRVNEVDIINGQRLTGTVSIKHLRLLSVAVRSFRESITFAVAHRLGQLKN